MNAKQQLTDELMAVLWRYSQESDITLLEAIQATHASAERLIEASSPNS